MEQRLSLVTLGVRDLAKSRAFYAKLGFRESSASNDDVAFFQLGGIGLGLWSRESLAQDGAVSSEGGGFAGVALAHNVRTQDEVAVVLEEARAAGATITKPAGPVFWGGYTGYFTDPDGHLWEVAWNPMFPLDDEGRVSLPQ